MENRYLVSCLIGEGGMGKVYKAYDKTLGRTVALKILKKQESPKLQEAFLREAKILSKLCHPNIVTLYEYGKSQKETFFVMEYLEGNSLDKLCQKRMPVIEILEIVLKIAHALEYAHSQGIVHSDIKPSNFFLCQKEPKILDFGLASQESQSISQENKAAGTLLYMSPERIQGKQSGIDKRSDVYSLGCVLYELLTGRPPFFSKNPSVLVNKILHEQPLQPGKIRKSIHPALNAICLKALEKDPQYRYGSMKEMGEDIEAIIQDRTPKVYHPSSYRRRLSLLFFLVILSSIGLLWNFGSDIPCKLKISAPLESFAYRLLPMEIEIKNFGSNTLDFLHIQAIFSPGIHRHEAKEESFSLSVGQSKNFTHWIYADAPGKIHYEIVLAKEKKKIHSVRKEITIKPSLYGLPADSSYLWECQGSKILDMTHDWQKLSADEQKEMASCYRLGYCFQNKLQPEIILMRNKVPVCFVLIPPGRFWMGCTEGEQKLYSLHDPENSYPFEPAQRVVISKPYYMSKYEITQKQWEAIMTENPSFFLKEKNFPVSNVSYDQCQEFCHKTGFRLPSEAEWEYACRAGSSYAFYWGKDWHKNITNTLSYWMKKEVWKEQDKEDFNILYRATVTIAGSFPPNAFGLYDMIGNVQEWCQADDYTYIKPISQDSPEYGILRGGAWWSTILKATSCYREIVHKATQKRHANGIRVIVVSKMTK